MIAVKQGAGVREGKLTYHSEHLLCGGGVGKWDISASKTAPGEGNTICQNRRTSLTPNQKETLTLTGLTATKKGLKSEDAGLL